MSLSESNAGTLRRTVSWRPAAVCLVAALGLVGLFFVDAVAPALARIEHWTADWRAALLSERLPSSHPKLALVTVNLDTLKNFPFIVPIDRGLQADIVSAVDRAGAKAIALDFYYTKDTIPKSDEKFLKALKEARAQIILGVNEDNSVLKPAQIKYQYDLINRVNAKAGYLNLDTRPDEVVRFRSNLPDDIRYRLSFSELLAQAAGWQQTNPPKRISWLLRPWDGSGTFLRVEAHKLLNSSATAVAQQLKDRVVIIAGDLLYFDKFRTPLSLLSGKYVIGAEIHAQMAAELIDGGRSYSELPRVQRDIFLAGLACVGILLGWQFRRRHFDFLDWRGVSVVVIAIDAMFFKFGHLVLPFTLAAYAWLLAVMFGTHLGDAIQWTVQRFRAKA